MSTVIGSTAISTTYHLTLTKCFCSMPQLSHLQDGPSNTLLYNSEMCLGKFTVTVLANGGEGTLVFLLSHEMGSYGRKMQTEPGPSSLPGL